MASQSDPAPVLSKPEDQPLRYFSDAPAARSFAWSLRHGLAKGFAVCAKPLRFAELPEAVATTYAEIGETDCGYVFESEAAAQRRLAAIPPEGRLGWKFSIKEVSYRAEKGARDGPTLDVTGHPFAMRLFVVDKDGGMARWEHGGSIGWSDGPPNAAGTVAEAESIFRALQTKFSRRRNKG